MTQSHGGPGGGQGPLDITKSSDKGQSVLIQDVPPFTELWAKIARPFAWAVFALNALVIFIPFLLLGRWLSMTNVTEWTARSTAMLDWAKTVLPPVVGFGSAVVGYFFGTRASISNGSGSKPGSGANTSG